MAVRATVPFAFMWMIAFSVAVSRSIRNSWKVVEFGKIKQGDAMRKRNLILPIMISLLFVYTGQTQDTLYHLVLSSVTGGGGDAGNEFYSAQLTIAQPFQGEGSSPEYSFSSGFSSSATLLLSTIAVTKQFRAQWNIVSVPLFVEDGRKSILFLQAISNAFAFLPATGYQARDTLDPAAGYWIKFPSAPVVTMVGLPRLRDTIAVSEGWNLIGSLSKTIGCNDISAIPPNIRSSQFFQYNQVYQAVDSLEPMAGYWIKAYRDGFLILGQPDSGTSAIFPKAQYNKLLHDFNNLTIVDKLGNQQILYFRSGDSLMCSINTDQFEMPPSPPEGAFDVRFLDNHSLNTFRKDLENQSSGIAIQSEHFPLQISWTVAQGDSGKYILTDGFVGKVFKPKVLNGRSSLKIDDPLLQRFALTYNGRAYSQPLPKEYALRQNYPNPFNPITTVRFDLPVYSKVTLTMYDILGRNVVTLVDDQEYEAGLQEAIFNATNYASGVYFYRLEAVDINKPSKSFVQMKKMLLLK